jgi:predicted methyltransferase
MRMTRFHRLSVLAAIVGALCSVPRSELFAQAPDNAADTKRLIEILKIQPGAIVADVGAGPGELTLPMARAIGNTGRIYATDINPQRLEELRQIATSQANVLVIQGGSVQTNLPANCCDAIFMRHVYHHIGDPAVMNRSLLQSLKPGAQLAVIDFAPDPNAPGGGITGPPGRRDTKQSHGVAPTTVADELRSAGFIHVEEVAWTQRPYFAVVGERPR